MAEGRGLGTDSPGLGPPGPGKGGAASIPQRLGGRQPVGADHGKGGPRGIDGGKKVKGRKRQVLTDTGGRILKVHVHPANVHDRWGGEAVLGGLDLSLWPRVERVYADRGYLGLWGFARGRSFRAIPKRWVVERTFAWLVRNRRLRVDYELHPEVSAAWVYVAMIRLLVKRLARAA